MMPFHLRALMGENWCASCPAVLHTKCYRSHGREEVPSSWDRYWVGAESTHVPLHLVGVEVRSVASLLREGVDLGGVHQHPPQLVFTPRRAQSLWPACRQELCSASILLG